MHSSLCTYAIRGCYNFVTIMVEDQPFFVRLIRLPLGTERICKESRSRHAQIDSCDVQIWYAL
jgi:hypothetical protein